MCGAAQESRAGVLPCYHQQFEILEQILKSTPDFSKRKASPGLREAACAHTTVPAAQGHRTPLAKERFSSIVGSRKQVGTAAPFHSCCDRGPERAQDLA